jgi:hypothetical protein
MNRLKDFVDPVAWAMIPCMLAAIALLAPGAGLIDFEVPVAVHHAAAHAESPTYLASHPLPKRVRS